MHSIKVRSLVSTMALFTPTHFFAYNDNRHEDFILNFMTQNVLKAILSNELSTILSIILFSTLSGLPH